MTIIQNYKLACQYLGVDRSELANKLLENALCYCYDGNGKLNGKMKELALLALNDGANQAKKVYISYIMENDGVQIIRELIKAGMNVTKVHNWRRYCSKRMLKMINDYTDERSDSSSSNLYG